MRILMGKWKGHSFPQVVNSKKTRPTTSFAKEGIMNVLLHNYGIRNAKALDLFAGTGSISFELLSLGADYVCLVEQSQSLCKQVREIANTLSISKATMAVLPMSVTRFFGQSTYVGVTYDIIFADPPFSFPHKREILFQTIEYKLLNTPSSVFICEHASSDESFQRISFPSKVYRYGDVSFSVFKESDLIC